MRDPLNSFALPGPFASPRFIPSRLFLSAAGVLFDPSRLDTLTQDAAGAVPVTAAGQPVGLVRDQSGGARNASQSTSAARPTLGRHPRTGRRNLLTWTEDFSNAAWVKAGGVVVTGSVQLGAAQAFTLTDAVSDWSYIVHPLALTGPVTTSAQIRLAKDASATTLASMRFRIATSTGARYCGVHCDPRNGVSIGDFGSWTYGRASFAVEDGGDYWLMRVTCDLPPGDQIIALDIYPAHYNFAGGGGSSVVGGNTFAAPQVEVGAPSAYQRVAAATDVTEAGVPDLYYLSFDGVDDWLTTASMTLAAGGRTIIAAVRKRASAAGVVVETTPSWTASPGGVSQFAPAPSNSATYGSRVHLSTSQSLIDTPPSFAVPHTAVLSSVMTPGSPGSHIVRVNGHQAASDVQVGEIPALTAPLAIGSRSGFGVFAGIDLYGLIVIDRVLTAQELALAEAWAAAKCGVVL